MNWFFIYFFCLNKIAVDDDGVNQFCFVYSIKNWQIIKENNLSNILSLSL